MRRRRTSNASDATSASDEQLGSTSGSGDGGPSDVHGDSAPASYVPPRTTPAQLLPLLQCRLCIDASDLLSQHTFSSPTTLPCGHTLCASHLLEGPDASAGPSSSITQADDPLSPSSCPLPDCPSLRRNLAHIIPTVHPASSVAVYLPLRPPLETTAATASDVPGQRGTDIKIKKLLDLVQTSTPTESALLPSESSQLPATSLDRRKDAHRRKRIRRNAEPAPSLFTKQLREILTCEVCFILYYEPMTLRCGHTFCATCLQRTLDQDKKCPLCRAIIGAETRYALSALAVQGRDLPTNQVLLGILLLAFAKDYMTRRKSIANDTANAHAGNFNLPIYPVMEILLPGSRTHLSFAQPSLRLMLRRILAMSSAKLGVMLPPTSSTAANTPSGHGTFATIRSVQYLPDNSAVAELTGDPIRFRLLESTIIDGYTVARVEGLEDCPELDTEFQWEEVLPTLEGHPIEPDDLLSAKAVAAELSEEAPEEDPSIEEMTDYCCQFISNLGTDAAPWIVKRFHDECGEQPVDDPAAFTWWVAAHLPLPPQDKLKLLPIRCPKIRLRLLCHWIATWNEQWWYSRGCVII